MQTFGERLAAARKAKGMTQEALSQAANVARNTISSWERGRTIPDIDSVKRLSEILGVDLSKAAEEDSAAPAVEASAEVELQAAPAVEASAEAEAQQVTANENTGKPAGRVKRWHILAGAAALVCIVLLFCLFSPRKSAPTGDGEAFDVQYYLQETPNEAGKAYCDFEKHTWEQEGDNYTYQRYTFTMYEKNGVGFNVERVELSAEGANSPTVRSATYGPNDLRAVSQDPEIAPYGSLEITGGFPVGEFSRVGVAVFGNDANGEAMVFYSLIEF